MTINTGFEEKYQSTRAYDDFFFEPVNVWDLSSDNLRPDVNFMPVEERAGRIPWYARPGL